MFHALELVNGREYSNVICVKLSARLFWIMLLSAQCASPNNVYCSARACACVRACVCAYVHACVCERVCMCARVYVHMYCNLFYLFVCVLITLALVRVCQSCVI